MTPLIKWLDKNMFWLAAGIVMALTLIAHYHNQFLAMLAFLLLFIVLMIAGVYDANIRFTKKVLDAYDTVVKVQQNRRKLRVLKGGKHKRELDANQP